MNQNAASRKDIRQAEKAAKLAEIRAREVTTELMSTPAGREWLWNNLAECHIFEQSFVPNDPLTSAFREGERAVGLRLLSVVMLHCPDQYVQAARESNERTASAERARSQNGDGGDQGREPLNDPGDFNYADHRDDEGNLAFDGYQN